MPKQTKSEKTEKVEKTDKQSKEDVKESKSNNKSKASNNDDDSENISVVKLSTTTEKFINELSHNKTELTQECANIDRNIDALEAKVKKLIKNKSLSDDDSFSEQRNIYIQIATCVARLDEITGLLIHSLNNMFKAKKAGDCDEIEKDVVS